MSSNADASVADDDAGAPPPGRLRWLRAAFIVMALAFAALALASQWEDVQDRIGRLSIRHVSLAAAFAVGSLVASFLAWRETLAGLGDRLPVRVAARIFYVGQLAKYVPGSIWSIVGQVELARIHGVRRERTATAGIVVLIISLSMALILGLLAVPSLLASEDPLYAGVALLLVPLAVVLHPKVLAWLVSTGLRLLRRPPPSTSLSGATIRRVALLSLVNNGLLGLQLWQLTVDLGEDTWTLLPRAVGAYGIATALGLVAVPIPAGAGVREAALVLVLSPELGVAGATLVAVLARLILTVSDLAIAGVATVATRSERSGELPRPSV
jgi:uncharacterized membrane protein YbhN (UPF0104 family)